MESGLLDSDQGVGVGSPANANGATVSASGTVTAGQNQEAVLDLSWLVDQDSKMSGKQGQTISETGKSEVVVGYRSYLPVTRVLSCRL